MNEHDWLTCTDPVPMLRFLGEQPSSRKLRLFTCACCRFIWHLLVDERSRQAVEAAERYADQQIGEEQLLDAEKAATQAASELMRAEAHAAASAAARIVTNTSTVVWQTAWAVVRSRIKDVSRQIAEREVVRKAALADLAALLRDLIGNPFHPVPFDLAWLTPTVTSVAKVIYDERRFEELPILADALEEAGCTDAELLGHLRGPGPHVRGCYAVDAVLGRS